MVATQFCYGVPDIRMPRVDGGEINPCELIGHDFIVFFCPADREAATREIEDYCSRLQEFEKGGVWLIGVLTDSAADLPEHPAGRTRLPLARDPGGAGWAAFESLLDAGLGSREEGGGTFLFARGGCLARAWAGSGHAGDALGELHRQS